MGSPGLTALSLLIPPCPSSGPHLSLCSFSCNSSIGVCCSRHCPGPSLCLHLLLGKVRSCISGYCVQLRCLPPSHLPRLPAPVPCHLLASSQDTGRPCSRGLLRLSHHSPLPTKCVSSCLLGIIIACFPSNMILAVLLSNTQLLCPQSPLTSLTKLPILEGVTFDPLIKHL